MKKQKEKKRRRSRTGSRTGLFAALGCYAVVLLTAGCSAVEFAKPEGSPSNQQVYDAYNQVELRKSTSADVLAAFGNPRYALLSQTKNIIALAGDKKSGYKQWFNMVTFDDDLLIARSKYVFISDEKPKQLFVEPWEGVYFDCRIVLPEKLLNEPFANDNARQIAVLKQVVATVRKETGEIGADNKDVLACGMIAGQALDIVLARLNDSPATTIHLVEPSGYEFQHPAYKTGRLRTVIEGEVAIVSLRLGSFAKESLIKVSFEKPVRAD